MLLDDVIIPLWTILRDNGFNTAQILIIISLAIFYFKPFRSLSKEVSSIKDKFNDLHNAGWEMQTHLGKGKKGKLEPLHKLDKLNWANANSPFVLNEKGKQLEERSGIKEIVAQNIGELLKKVEENKPSAGYDVERYSFNVLSEFVHANLDIEKRIKDFIYNNPVFQGKEVGFGDIFFVGSIQLREEYFKKHPEIKPSKTEVGVI